MKKIICILLVVIPVLLGEESTGQPLRKNLLKNHWNHDYSHTLVMKMALSVVNKDGSPNVLCNFEKALSLIRQTDNITLGVPKIIYLVGWQYNGHDDKYPAFFEVNNALKRPADKDARTSLIWLMKEAKKYNTTISLHINMTDAYDNSPLWKEYIQNDLISKNADGSLMVIGQYNNRKAYQINYRNEWKKGYAQKRIDKLLALLPPLKKAGTIHIDAWIARNSPGHQERSAVEKEYQKKIWNYWHSKGIDVSSEWVMDYMVGLIPHYWHFNHWKQDDYIKIPADICTGTHKNPDLKDSDFGLEFLFGTSFYGENLFPNTRNNRSDSEWEKLFTKDFFLHFVQYNYLNHFDRLGVEGKDKNREAFYSDNIRVSLRDSTVVRDSQLLRSGNTICYPAFWRKDSSLVAYSDKNTQIYYTFPENQGRFTQVQTYLVSKEGLELEKTLPVKDNQIEVILTKDKPLLILPLKKPN